MEDEDQQSPPVPLVGHHSQRRLPRVRSTPTYANMHSIVDEDDYDSRLVMLDRLIAYTFTGIGILM